MTPTERDIDEILAKAMANYKVEPWNGGRAFTEAKQAIQAHYEKLMLDIIGEDENDTAPDGEILRDSVMRNRLRANLRDKLNG